METSPHLKDMGSDPICFEQIDSSNTESFVMESYDRARGFSFMVPKFPTIVMMPDLKIQVDNQSENNTSKTVRSKGTQTKFFKVEQKITTQFVDDDDLPAFQIHQNEKENNSDDEQILFTKDQQDEINGYYDMFFEIEQKTQHFQFSEIFTDGPLGNGDYPGIRRDILTPKFDSSNSDRGIFSDRSLNENEIKTSDREIQCYIQKELKVLSFQQQKEFDKFQILPQKQIIEIALQTSFQQKLNDELEKAKKDEWLKFKEKLDKAKEQEIIELQNKLLKEKEIHLEEKEIKKSKEAENMMQILKSQFLKQLADKSDELQKTKEELEQIQKNFKITDQKKQELERIVIEKDEEFKTVKLEVEIFKKQSQKERQEIEQKFLQENENLAEINKIAISEKELILFQQKQIIESKEELEKQKDEISQNAFQLSQELQELQEKLDSIEQAKDYFEEKLLAAEPQVTQLKKDLNQSKYNLQEWIQKAEDSEKIIKKLEEQKKQKDFISSELLLKEQELEKLKIKLEKVNELTEVQKKELTDKTGELEKIKQQQEQQINELMGKLQQAIVDKMMMKKLNEENSEIKLELDKVQKKQQISNDKNFELEQSLDKVNTLCDELNTFKNVVEKQKPIQVEKVKSLEVQIKQQKEIVDSLYKQLEDVTQSKETVEKDKKILDDKFKQLNDDYHKVLENYKHNIFQLERAEEEASQVSQVKQEVKNLQEQIQQFQKQIIDSKKVQSDLQNKLKAKEFDENMKKHELQVITQRQVEIKIKLQRKTEKSNDIIQQLTELDSFQILPQRYMIDIVPKTSLSLFNTETQTSLIFTDQETQVTQINTNTETQTNKNLQTDSQTQMTIQFSDLETQTGQQVQNTETQTDHHKSILPYLDLKRQLSVKSSNRKIDTKRLNLINEESKDNQEDKKLKSFESKKKRINSSDEQEMPNTQILLNDTLFGSYREKDSDDVPRSPNAYLDDSLKNIKYYPNQEFQKLKTPTNFLQLDPYNDSYSEFYQGIDEYKKKQNFQTSPQKKGIKKPESPAKMINQSMLNQSYQNIHLLNTSMISKMGNNKPLQGKKKTNLKGSSNKKTNQVVKQHTEHAPIMPKRIYKIESDDEIPNQPIKSNIRTDVAQNDSWQYDSPMNMSKMSESSNYLRQSIPYGTPNTFDNQSEYESIKRVPQSQILQKQNSKLQDTSNRIIGPNLQSQNVISSKIQSDDDVNDRME